MKIKKQEELLKKLLLESLLDKKIINFDFVNLTTFHCGYVSPVYSNLRDIRAHVRLRATLLTFLYKKYINKYDINVIMGVYKGAAFISEGLADRFGYPSAYVQSEKKVYGLDQEIVGANIKGKNVIIFEDVITTGKSLMRDVQKAKDEGAFVKHCVSILNYEFENHKKNFAKIGTHFHSLFTIKDLDDFVKANFNEQENQMWDAFCVDPESWHTSFGIVKKEK